MGQIIINTDRSYRWQVGLAALMFISGPWAVAEREPAPSSESPFTQAIDPEVVRGIQERTQQLQAETQLSVPESRAIEEAIQHLDVTTVLGRQGLRAFGKSQGLRALPAVAALLESPVTENRHKAMRVLTGVDMSAPGYEATPAGQLLTLLLRRALNDQEPTIRVQAVRGLGGSAYVTGKLEPWVVEILKRMLNDESVGVRGEAAVCLIKSGHADDVPDELRKQLEHIAHVIN
jgi:HEAT repeat protein